MYVRNPSETDTRTYDLSLSTENSAITPTFQSSGTQNLEVDVNPGSRKSVLMQVPTRKTDTVKIDVTDQASGISRSVSFDVQPVEKQTTEVRNVPGIGVLQVFVAGLVATAYSLLL
jgi:hypothetical protein